MICWNKKLHFPSLRSRFIQTANAMRFVFIKLVLVQFVSAHSGPASSCIKNSLPGMVGMRLEVTAFVGP